MKLQLIVILAFAAGLAGCAEKEPTAADEGVDEQAIQAEDAAPAADVEAPPAQAEAWRDAVFIKHMHQHAEYLDDLNFALDDEDLEMAMPPAYWLSRHDSVEGLPEELQPFLTGMREAARAVEAAEDLDAARAAAQQIGKQCQACHAAAGVSTQ